MKRFLRLRIFKRIQKRICDLGSYGFFTTKQRKILKRIIYHDINGMSSRAPRDEKKKREKQQTHHHGEDK